MAKRSRYVTGALVAAAVASVVGGAVVSADAMGDSDVAKFATVRIAASLTDDDGVVIACEYLGVDLATITAFPLQSSSGISVSGPVTGVAKSSAVAGTASAQSDAAGGSAAAGESDAAGDALDSALSVARAIPIDPRTLGPGPYVVRTVEGDAGNATFGVVAVGASPLSSPTAGGNIRIVRPANVRPGTAAECAELQHRGRSETTAATPTGATTATSLTATPAMPSMTATTTDNVAP